MDSLRNLSTSLPRTSPSTSSPHELLSAFKAAALSVTNLYKTAATDTARARAAGYQDALDELLTLMDRENLGLGVDGEGWRVRQWATERYDGSGRGGGGSSDDEEEREAEETQRQESPEVQRKQDQQHQQHQQDHTQAQQPETPADQAQEEDEDEVRVEAVPTPQHLPTSDMFSFRSSVPYPSGNHDRDMDTELSNHGSSETANSSASIQHAPSMTVNLVPRHRNNRHTHGHRNTSGSNRTTTHSVTAFGSGAGSKRKAVPDFFDIGGFGGFGGFGSNGFGGGKDADRFGGGGKRGRHV